MAATEIHGITDADVADAPRFNEIAGEFIAQIKDCVLASYNVYFDMGFLNFELSNCGVNHQPPYVCLMYMRPLLGLGDRCTLSEACRKSGIGHETTHKASTDALAASGLFVHYLEEFRNKGINTYEDIASLKKYKFTQSFTQPPFPEPAVFRLNRSQNLLPRTFSNPATSTFGDIASYWDNLKTVFTDEVITPEELNFLRNEIRGLRKEQVRAIHARFFLSTLTKFTKDLYIDEEEANRLRSLYQGLSLLGWAPGQ